MTKTEFIVAFRRATSLPLLECQKIGEQTGHDLEEALQLTGFVPVPMEEELPFYSKVSTEEHSQSVECPHCNETFYCRGFGSTAG